MGVLPAAEYGHLDYFCPICLRSSYCGAAGTVHHICTYYLIKMRGNIGMEVLTLVIRSRLYSNRIEIKIIFLITIYNLIWKLTG